MAKTMKASKNETESLWQDKALWALVSLLLVVGLYGNYVYLQSVSSYLRIAALIVLFAVLLGLSALTTQGKLAFQFLKSAKMELRKVSWPTRQETVQTTLIVLVMIIVVALMLWGIDALFMWAVSWLTGQRG